MSPDSPHPSRQRRAWRAMSAAGVLLAALSLFLSAVLWRGQTTKTEKATCAIVDYAERQAGNIARGGNLDAARELDRLAMSMRRTGISCPPKAA